MKKSAEFRTVGRLYFLPSGVLQIATHGRKKKERRSNALKKSPRCNPASLGESLLYEDAHTSCFSKAPDAACADRRDTSVCVCVCVCECVCLVMSTRPFGGNIRLWCLFRF